MRRLSRGLCSLALLTGLASPAAAKDFVLTIGGGYSPFGNQVSLEKNVQFFERVLAERLPADYRHDVYFADGDDPARDLQFLDDGADSDPACDLLADVFGQTDHLGERYRNHELPQAAGAATPENVRDWFDGVGKTLTPQDRLTIYVTAHGGRGDKKTPRDTKLYFWNHATMSVRELAERLDALPPELPVVLVMVQCYSGGFADLAFAGGDENAGPTGHNRCGFFATTHDRPAAGCTPDIDEEDYHEYSSGFLAAILGRTRTGGDVPDADLDGDGVVGFAEAHAAVLIHSDTIDIPVKTSDALLRSARSDSKRRPAPLVAAKPGEAVTVTALRPVAPLSADATVESLLAFAEAPERAVIVGLSERLGFSRSDRAVEARERATEIQKRRKELRSRIGKAEKQAAAARKPIKEAVLVRWPELAGAWNAAGREAFAAEGDAMVELVEAHPQYAELVQAEDRAAEADEQSRDLERDWVKCQRLVRVLETVALAHNLPQTAPDLLPRYERMRRAEAATLER